TGPRDGTRREPCDPCRPGSATPHRRAVRRLLFLPWDVLDPISNSRGRFDRKARGLPFGIAILKAMNAIAPLSQSSDRLKREDTVRAAAISDHLSVGGKLAQAAFELGERDIERAGKMPDRKLILRPYVENRDRAVLQPSKQIVSGDRLKRIAGIEIVIHDAVDLG